jgi:sulfate transport system permease protein
MPLHIEALYDDYNFTGAFAVASLLAFLALITLALKTWVEYRNHELRGTAFTPVPVANKPVKNL